MKITKLLIVPALILTAATITPGLLQAYRGDPEVKGPNYTAERHEAMLGAFNTADYDAWKALMPSQSRVSRVITRENFGKFMEMRQLMLDGKKVEANAVRAELGLGQGRMLGNGQNR